MSEDLITTLFALGLIAVGLVLAVIEVRERVRSHGICCLYCSRPLPQPETIVDAAGRSFCSIECWHAGNHREEPQHG